MTVTFVSAFMDLKDGRLTPDLAREWFQQFAVLASTTIPLHCFLSRSLEPLKETYLQSFPNVKIDYIELQDLQMYKSIKQCKYQLPQIRYELKDTEAFMITQNAKPEFVRKSILQNPFGSTHYAWIDFRICHVFRSPETTLQWLRDLGTTIALKPTLCLFPGCWAKGMHHYELLRKVNWRFCGGFFIGDAVSMLQFADLALVEVPKLVAKYGVLPWEVNLWHYLELETSWKPSWIPADHNDSIVQVPPQFQNAG
jgi:hypothetical protein